MSKLFLLPAFALLALIGCGDKDDDTAVEAEETEVVDTAEEVSEPEDQEGEEEA